MAKKADQSAPKSAQMSRFDAAALAIRQLKEETTLVKLSEAADALFAKAGGQSDPPKMLSSTKWAMSAAEKLGLVKVDRIVVIRPIAKA